MVPNDFGVLEQYQLISTQYHIARRPRVTLPRDKLREQPPPQRHIPNPSVAAGPSPRFGTLHGGEDPQEAKLGRASVQQEKDRLAGGPCRL